MVNFTDKPEFTVTNVRCPLDLMEELISTDTGVIPSYEVFVLAVSKIGEQLNDFWMAVDPFLVDILTVD